MCGDWPRRAGAGLEGSRVCNARFLPPRPPLRQGGVPSSTYPPGSGQGAPRGRQRFFQLRRSAPVSFRAGHAGRRFLRRLSGPEAPKSSQGHGWRAAERKTDGRPRHTMLSGLRDSMGKTRPSAFSRRVKPPFAKTAPLRPRPVPGRPRPSARSSTPAAEKTHLSEFEALLPALTPGRFPIQVYETSGLFSLSQARLGEPAPFPPSTRSILSPREEGNSERGQRVKLREF